MNREDFKTLLLILLVCVSIFFTRKLWIEVPKDLIPIFKKNEDITSSYVFSDMIVPHKFLLNFNEKNHTLLYSDEKYGLWSSAKTILREVLSGKNFRTNHINSKEFMEYQNKKSITFSFSEKISTYILAKAIDVSQPNDVTKEISKINNIYVCLEKNSPFVILGNGESFVKVTDLKLKTSALREILSDIEKRDDYTHYYSMKDTLGSENDIYIPYEMNHRLPTVYVQNEIKVDNKEEIRDIAERFFDKDIDYLREIVENNGSTIYIYNQKVLKVYKNGFLEYFSPLEEPVTERNLYISLNTAADFISNHLGAPEGMYIEKIEEIKSDKNLGYRFTFKYRIRGIPILIGNDEIEDFIQIEVFNSYVKTYRRFIRKDMNLFQHKKISEEKKMLSAFEVMDMNYDLIESRYINDKGIIKKGQNENLSKKIEASILDISLAYFDPCVKESDEKLIGVWTITVERRVYAFDVYTGRLIYEKSKL